jgi:hypothetical protein
MKAICVSVNFDVFMVSLAQRPESHTPQNWNSSKDRSEIPGTGHRHLFDPFTAMLTLAVAL